MKLSTILNRIISDNTQDEVIKETCIYSIKNYMIKLLEEAIEETVGKDGATTICKLREKIEEIG